MAAILGAAMGAAKVADYALALLDVLPRLMAAGLDITETVRKHKAALEKMKAENREPTAAEWDELNAQLNRDAFRLQSAHAGA